MARPFTPLAVRFWAKVEKTPTCWEWRGATVTGYGHISMGGVLGKIRLAHRISWEMHNGPIPDGLHVCHRCDNPKCVRPDHLFLGTDLDNAQDRDAKGRSRPANSLKTHCKYGHEFSPQNTHIRPTGARRCRACARNEYHAQKLATA